MAKKTITPDLYNTTVDFLEDQINIYKFFATSATGEETIEKYALMQQESENMLDEFKKRYTWRKRRYSKKQGSEKEES